MKKAHLKLLLLISFFLCSFFDAFPGEIPKVIYGDDNRVEVQDAPLAFQRLAKSTAAMFSKKKLTYDSLMKVYVPEAKSLMTSNMVCEDEPFSQQLAVAECSSFLVKDDVLITAGHCIKNDSDCENSFFVFDYYNLFDLDVSFPEKNVFECKEIIAQELNFSTLLDFAVIRLNRKVTNRKPLKLRSPERGKIREGDPLIVIGYPSGLPAKIADNAFVKENTDVNYFKANLDTYGGNSGSAVINPDTEEVEGILVRGEKDYELDFTRGCYVSHRCNDDFDESCRGEGITRISVVEGL